MSDLQKANVVVVVFAMPGCPACHEYLPRLRRQIAAFKKAGYPVFEYEQGMVAERGQIPVVVVDSTSQDQGVVSLADQHQVTALPTTVLLPRIGFPARWEGALSEEDAGNVLQLAVASNF